jgi:hypothetical protein
MKPGWIFLIAVICLTACRESGKSPLPDTWFKDLNGNKIYLGTDSHSGIRVFMFLTYDCPLSASYTGPMNRMVADSLNQQVSFYYVFPGLAYPDDSVTSFAKKYRLNADVVFDPDYSLSRSLEATVTPQVIILDSGENVVYSGAFDDWAFEPGRKRQVVEKHYAADALYQIKRGDKPDPAFTEPIGCFIEY